MYRRFVTQALRLGLLVTLLVFALCACAAGEKSISTARPLSPGEHTTSIFRPPLSFSVGEGWRGAFPESHDAAGLEVTNPPESFLVFLSAARVYDPNHLEEVDPQPKDMVGWLQEHPRLDVEEPSQVSVGGLVGQQFDAVASEPTDVSWCSEGIVASETCVPLFALTSGTGYALGKTDKIRFIVLDNVKGQTVTIYFVSPAVDFEEFLPTAQKVLDSVKWSGS
jgi:hypothetical protein